MKGGLNELALFAGAGGGILGGKLLGWHTVCAVEFNSFCCRRLMQRQNEGYLPPFPIWDDVRTFDGRPWCGVVDVVSGGFPCQDISAVATTERKGLDGSKSVLWYEFARILSEVRPRYAFVENSDKLVTNGLNRVLGSLAELGYDAEWCVLGASDCGASHKRKRTWVVARNAALCGCDRSVGQLECVVEESGEPLSVVSAQQVFPRNEDDLPFPRVYGSSDGVAHRVDRSRAIGNGQVPIVAATAWTLLLKRFQKLPPLLAQPLLFSSE